MKHILSFEICMDILDWFNDSNLDYINHILIAKSDGEERINHAMDEISAYCRDLVETYSETDRAYPYAI